MRLRSIAISILIALTRLAVAQDLPVSVSGSRVGPHDVIEIKVLEDATIGGRVTVTGDGDVVLEVVGKVQVAGLTAPAIEAKLTSLLTASVLKKATVSVQIVELASKTISVVGAVVRPGQIKVTGTMTIVQAITEAGGLSGAHGRELYIVRTGRGGLTERLAFDIEELMVLGNPDLNVPLAPNDLVNVPVDTPLTIYILGEVMKPGKAQFRHSQTPTLLQVIADAGGPTDRASKIAIIKRVEGGKEQTIKVNYRDILRGRRADFVLNDNDTVLVGAALF